MENVEICGKCGNFGKLRKYWKFKKKSKHFEEKSCLKMTSKFPPLEPWDSPFTKVILHSCMNDIYQLCCITYICVVIPVFFRSSKFKSGSGHISPARATLLPTVGKLWADKAKELGVDPIKLQTWVDSIRSRYGRPSQDREWRITQRGQCGSWRNSVF